MKRWLSRIGPSFISAPSKFKTVLKWNDFIDKLPPKFRQNAGVSADVVVKQNLVGDALNCTCQELEGRTGETDSEVED